MVGLGIGTKSVIRNLAKNIIWSLQKQMLCQPNNFRHHFYMRLLSPALSYLFDADSRRSHSNSFTITVIHNLQINWCDWTFFKFKWYFTFLLPLKAVIFQNQAKGLASNKLENTTPHAPISMFWKGQIIFR